MDGSATIGWREWVGIPELQRGPVLAKVDTGAWSNTLHASEIEIIECLPETKIRFKQRDGWVERPEVGTNSANLLAPSVKSDPTTQIQTASLRSRLKRNRRHKPVGSACFKWEVRTKHCRQRHQFEVGNQSHNLIFQSWLIPSQLFLAGQFPIGN